MVQTLCVAASAGFLWPALLGHTIVFSIIMKYQIASYSILFLPKSSTIYVVTLGLSNSLSPLSWLLWSWSLPSCIINVFITWKRSRYSFLLVISWGVIAKLIMDCTKTNYYCIQCNLLKGAGLGLGLGQAISGLLELITMKPQSWQGPYYPLIRTTCLDTVNSLGLLQ